jgi:hypothetical protein
VSAEWPPTLVRRLLADSTENAALQAWFIMGKCQCAGPAGDPTEVWVRPNLVLTFCGDCGRPTNTGQLPDQPYAKGDFAVYDGALVTVLHAPDITGGVFVANADPKQPANARTVHALLLNLEDA